MQRLRPQPLHLHLCQSQRLSPLLLPPPQLRLLKYLSLRHQHHPLLVLLLRRHLLLVPLQRPSRLRLPRPR